ncbi:ABC transporter ATP-binding protein [Ammoniphilus sp. CFH 90114]|uniref:ABC transporter ATP-binding protein n=1 Tax=Ammoniphilus sp. CFH 90114 TaxID=2493665 RepID=UPI00100ED0C2|nr:ABC transporter ATP-binding protein [Ammoniphilus sp. CFH 90114]RXT06550.1 ABC transporter ATP-binding protein [Ammoniphilus sp. CFH 90114]
MELKTRQKELLRVENMNIRFKGEGGKLIPAVRDLNFCINEGETVGLVGESGCGKSVTSLSLMRLIPPHSGLAEGKIILQDQDINQLSEREMRSLRGNRVSMIFQEPMTSLNPVQKIGKQIGEVIYLHSSLSKEEIQQKSIEMLKKVGIPRAEKIINDYPHQLSGGMRQRVVIAMAMACNPKLLIADEPTTALDVTIQAQILELMNELKEQYNTSILLITHDLGVIAEMADRVMVMYYGQIVEQADVRTLFKHPKHPYTIGLLNSVPDIDDESNDPLKPIEGNVPTLGMIKAGCAFRDRCQHSFQKCHEQNPPLFNHQGQLVRCWLYEGQEVIS